MSITQLDKLMVTDYTICL